MKLAQVNKLYSKLTPQEQAALVIEAAARHDESTADAIMEQVERKHYISTHAGYVQRIHALTILVGQYGIEYWKNRTLMLMACDYAENGHPEAKNNALQFLAKVVALETAIVDVCNQFKVDVAAIKSMAGCPDNDALPSQLPEVDADRVKEFIRMFTKLTSVAI